MGSGGGGEGARVDPLRPQDLGDGVVEVPVRVRLPANTPSGAYTFDLNIGAFPDDCDAKPAREHPATALTLAAFIFVEVRRPDPMLPLHFFEQRDYRAARADPRLPRARALARRKTCNSIEPRSV